VTTEAVTTTTLPAHHLAAMLDQVRPHAHDRDDLPAIAGVHLDSDGTHLHAVATDRFTIAVARRRLYTGETWAVTVATPHVAYLTGFAEAHNRRDTVTIDVTPGQLTVSSNQGRVTMPTVDGEFPNWRALFNKHLAENAETIDVAGLNTRQMRRWENAGWPVQTFQNGPTKPLFVIGDDMLGMQTAVRYEGGPDRKALLTDWAGSLGDATDPAAELPIPEPNSAIGQMVESLLHSVAISTDNMMDMPRPIDGLLLGAHAMASVNAWIGFRLLRALQDIDPQRAEQITAELSDELEAGDFSEAAWEYAVEAGHDPEKWVEEHQARRKERDAQAAAESA
jgi:hypothetical protein